MKRNIPESSVRISSFPQGHFNLPPPTPSSIRIRLHQFRWSPCNYFQGFLVLIYLHSVFISSGLAHAFLRYTEHSCIDLVPRNEPGGENIPYGPARSRFPVGKRKRSEFEQVPYKLVVTGKRYRRNSDLIVRIEGGEFEGLLIQARSLAATGEILRGGIGLIGQFRYLPFNFMYLPCHDIPFASVVDKGKPVQMSNVSIIWTSPDQDTGDIRFIASVLSGVHYWIIVSQILSFNPFPISTYGCGSILACFRVCPYGVYPCSARESRYVLSYNVDIQDKHEIYFTIGGRLPTNNSYLAVAFGEDFHSLLQADLVVCYMERGRPRLEHLLIESLQLPPYKHNDIIELDDYDVDGRMLWCRFRRPIIKGTYIDPKLSLYHFYFIGRIDYFHQTFIFPSRADIHTSAFRRNFSTPINEIISGASRVKITLVFVVIALHGCILVLI